MLNRFSSLNKEQQELVTGAVKYFVNEDDAVPDSTLLTGLDDDVLVMNHVLERLGLGTEAILID